MAEQVTQLSTFRTEEAASKSDKGSYLEYIAHISVKAMKADDVIYSAKTIVQLLSSGQSLEMSIKSIAIAQKHYAEFWQASAEAMHNGAATITDIVKEVWPDYATEIVEIGRVRGAVREALNDVVLHTKTRETVEKQAKKLLVPVIYVLIGVFFISITFLVVYPIIGDEMLRGNKSRMSARMLFAYESRGFINENALLVISVLAFLVVSAITKIGSMGLFNLTIALSKLSSSLRRDCNLLLYGMNGQLLVTLAKLDTPRRDSYRKSAMILPEDKRQALYLMANQLEEHAIGKSVQATDNLDEIPGYKVDPRKELPLAYVSAIQMSEFTSIEIALAETAPMMVVDGLELVDRAIKRLNLWGLMIAGLLIGSPILLVYAEYVSIYMSR